MKILIFGATGSVGKHLVKQAVDAGHYVTAFTRDASRVNGIISNLKAFAGDVLNPDDVARAVRGHDAVLITLGAGIKGRVRAEGTRNIIRAMEQEGVKRLVCQSTLGAGESRGNLNFFWKYLMFGMILRLAYKDHMIQESYVRQSSLDWTIVRPGAFTDGDLTGHYRHGFPGNDKSTELKVSRADVADFMIRQLDNNHYLHMMPGLSY